MRVRGCLLILLLLILFADEASAQSQPPSVALVGFDALGMDKERVQRLETLFLKELERLSGRSVPSRMAITKLSRKLRNCDGQTRCLSKIGKALKVDVVVSGNVAALGDSYILNIKAITSATGKELRRIESDPLRGAPEQLIDEIRVAAYRLLSPEQLRGAILVLADRGGANIILDGKTIGKTPLREPIIGLSLGEHHLRVDGGEFGSFDSDIVIRFQKTTKVIVSLVDLRIKSDTKQKKNELVVVHKEAPRAWYQKTWFLVSAGIGTAILAGYIGYRITEEPTIDCNSGSPEC